MRKNGLNTVTLTKIVLHAPGPVMWLCTKNGPDPLLALILLCHVMRAAHFRDVKHDI